MPTISTPLPAPASARAQSPEQRFTLDGGEALEEHLARICARIVHGVRGLIPPRRLEAVALGGGYGRSEGGVLVTTDGERTYNDIEFYVFVRGNRHVAHWRHARALDVLGEILTPAAGAHVEFKIASRRELERQPISMFSYDLISGHRIVHGPESIFRNCTHHRHAPRIPLSEASRLLMNRCSGLLLARDKLEAPAFTPGDADFVRRNIAKAALALGDAVLVALHRYHWSCRERHRRLAHDLTLGGMPRWSHDVLRLHEEGVHFKLHPERSTETREQLLARYEEILPFAQLVWLWIEERRLGCRFPDARSYALDARPKFPASTLGRDTVAHLKQNGWRGLMSGEPLKPPRERLLRALSLLLWVPDALRQPQLVTRLQRELQTDAVALPSFVRAYCDLWSRAS